MRLLAFIGTLLVSLPAVAETPASGLWLELKAKREKLPGFHQEFNVQSTKAASNTTAMARQIVLEVSGARWRERSTSGSGNYIRLFDGKDVFWMEEGGDEYERIAEKGNEGPMPQSYSFENADWSKAVELARRPCNIPGSDHACVVLEAPVRSSARANPSGHLTRIVGGTVRVALDLETGLMLSSRATKLIDDDGSNYQTDTTYVLRKIGYGTASDSSLFQLPADLRQVKELSRWDAGKIKKQLGGKPAPDLAVKDMQGKPLTLSSLRGKMVLLDFWATWCGPCRADAPSLDKLYRKYGEKDLAIVGISVSEPREIVEKFLKEHPHDYAVVLSSENEMLRTYQISVFPTYIVIDREGNIAVAVQGDRGFGDLRKMLKKAGLDTD